ncbi:MAG TPA: hypothetical protein PKD64_06780 [Pirellulaceae bacterium]|nr:hypothetical protein [Pirellulaceae bacterium]HMO91887.1 hypothetical protein [Pirellulaceae bacterium]HMP69703.1 hypothetical protein [Pirellulaceae bacterium]
MIPIRNGLWSIRRVAVNADQTANDDTFRQLIVNGKSVRIEPAGIDFSVNQSTSKSAILESRSQIFFADFFEHGERLRLTLSRPEFAETVSLDAEYLDVPAALYA